MVGWLSGRKRTLGRLKRRPADLGGRARFMHYIYILRSHKDKKLYIGKMVNLQKRVDYHKQGKVKSTKSKRPFILVYYEAYSDKDKWSRQENFYKTGIGRESLKYKI